MPSSVGSDPDVARRDRGQAVVELALALPVVFLLLLGVVQVAVVVRYTPPSGKDGEVENWIALLRKGKPERWLMRKLQRYIVRIHHRYALPMLGHGDIEELMPGLFVQVADGLYNPDFGLQLDHVQLTPEQYTI